VIVMPADRKTIKQPPQNWHAVGIRCAENACAAVQALRQRRYLSREAPRLPLADCTNPAGCHCRYRHFEDRRDGPRRDAETGASGIRRAPDVNRRSGRGRRSSD
jgi:hypothetical protein